MKIQQFLEHHGVSVNPFADEDAQTDPVFKDHCIGTTRHPSWDKIYGDPKEPATSVVFGEKGAGKTALRLQVRRHLDDYNRAHPDARVFIVDYDDFNPFLDRFRDRFHGRKRKPERVLAEWKLWDHMDAILSLATTQLDDALLAAPAAGKSGVTADPGRLDRLQARDVLLLAACYDQSTAETVKGRWHSLRRKLRFMSWKAQWDWPVAAVLTVILMLLAYLGDFWSDWMKLIWPFPLFFAVVWSPYLVRAMKRWWLSWSIIRNVRVLNRQTSPLRQILMNFTTDELSGQPLPNKQRTDDRYELLAKLQGVLKTLGFAGVIVLVDRVDEPDLMGGSSERMKALLWPMLDNKFLKQPGIGFKLLLPVELSHYVDREDRDFYQRARLDKQNVIRTLEWTGEALYDVANARLKACLSNGSTATLRKLFSDSISDRRLIDTLREMRVPRHLFKFMHQLFVAHSNAHTEDEPKWQITPETFESTLALYRREQEVFERGLKM